MSVSWSPTPETERADWLEQYESDQKIVAEDAFEKQLLPKFGPELATESRRERFITNGGVAIIQPIPGATTALSIEIALGVLWFVGLYRVIRTGRLRSGEQVSPRA